MSATELPPSMYDVARVHLPDAHLRAIGHVIVQWGNLEYLISLMIHVLLDKDYDDPTGFIVTAHMTFRAKMDVIKSLTDVLSTVEQYTHLVKFKKLGTRIDKLEAKRNTIVHGLWMYDAENNCASVGRGSARGTIKTSVEEFSVEKIEDLATEIGRAYIDLYKIILRRGN